MSEGFAARSCSWRWARSFTTRLHLCRDRVGPPFTAVVASMRARPIAGADLILTESARLEAHDGHAVPLTRWSGALVMPF